MRKRCGEADTDAIKRRLAEPKRRVRKTELKGVKKSYDHKVRFTAALATRYLELDPVQYEREVRDSWVEVLAVKMANGLFREEDVRINIANCLWDGKERRLNGQHTCWARLSMPNSWRPLVQVVKYAIKTEDDYRLLYMQKDQISIRTPGHRDGVGLIGTTEFSAFSPTVVKRAAQGFKFWYYEDQNSFSSEEVVGLMRGKFVKTTVRICELIELVLNLNVAHLKRGSVYAAMFETIHKAGDPATSFWQQLIHGLKFQSQRDPAKVLDKYLLEARVRGGNVRTSVSREHMYNVCVECFKAHRVRRPLSKTPQGTRDHRSSIK